MSDEDEEMTEPEPPSMDWLLTFADLISLLITFFVLLYSMKVVDVQKWDELKGSFSGVFSIRDPIHQVSPDKETSVEKVDPIQSDNLDYVQSLLERAFAGSPVLKDTKIKRDDVLDILTLEWSTEGIFDDTSASLKGGGLRLIGALGDILRHLDNRIVVAVHTDPRPVKTTEYASNWELTMLRALKISEVLEKQGIEKSIVSSAMAASRFHEVAPHLPIAERYKLARRVNIILHGEKDL